jgi:uncharacterized protein (TIGR01777 family)
MRVFITGGTGLVGSRLIKQLRQRKDSIVTLTRRPEAARTQLGGDCEIVAGDPMQAGDWMKTVEGCDAVVNLAGESIFNRRWSAAFKQLMHDSRIKSTENVVKALAGNPRNSAGNPKVLVNASAIGIYGPHGDEELTEESLFGDDVLARVCIDWEKAARQAEALGVRVVMLRIGVVLDRAGGALVQMMKPFKMFVGGRIGSGKQVLSWIHHADLTGLILLALDNAAATGPMNGTAPHPVTNREMSKALGRAMHRPSFFPTPKLMLRLALGEVASVVTTGQRVLPKKALALGYSFCFPTIEEALKDIFAQSA